MGTHPIIGKKRVIQRKKGKASSKKKSLKARSQSSGTFHMKARRSEIVTPAALGKGDLRCTECHAVYFDKHWHSPSVFGGTSVVKRLSLKPATCDECAYAAGPKRGPLQYAGEVVIKGRYSAPEKAEILRLIRNVGKRAVRRDPQDRIVKIESRGKAIRVFTSENQLAVSIGKQVHRARKRGKLTISWSRDDKPVRVTLER